MRSRDGNHSITLRIFSIILLSSLVLNAGEYLISYKYVVKNSILYNEHLEISKSMKKCNGNPAQFLILTSDGTKNFKNIISKNSEKFISFISKIGLNIQSTQKSINNQLNATTIMTLKTSCFKVDFNDNFAKITHLK
ncbi:hypothetical protein [Sulfurimonas sp.]